MPIIALVNIGTMNQNSKLQITETSTYHHYFRKSSSQQNAVEMW